MFQNTLEKNIYKEIIVTIFMGKTSLLFLLLTVVGLVGLFFVTAPSLNYMFGLADGNTDTNWFQVVGTIVIIWVSTGIFLLLTVGGVVLTFATWD